VATTEIYVHAKKERIWVSKLRQMPEGVFDLLIKRIAQGDSIRQIAKYCQTVRPEIAFETYRKWLQALSKLVAGYVADQEAVLAGQRAIDVYHKRKEEERREAEAAQSHEPATTDEALMVKANITAVLRDMEISDLLKDAWFIQHRRIRKLVEIEEKLGYSLPDGPKNIDSLGYILSLMMKHEMDTNEILRKGGGRPADIEMEKLSPTARAVGELDTVDRNLIQQLSRRFRDMMEGKADGAETEGLAVNGNGARGTVPGNNQGNSGTPIPGST
jgi:hypothetical protein